MPHLAGKVGQGSKLSNPRLDIPLDISFHSHRDGKQDQFALTMGKKRKELSQAEIWDDTALVQSWEDALDEYKVQYQITVLENVAKLGS